MKARVGPPPAEIRYPWWSWLLIDGVSKEPDLRRTEFNNYQGKHVLIELMIPRNELLTSDEETWHFVLNDWYLPAVDQNDDDVWDEAQQWLDRLSTENRAHETRLSWSRIFDPECPVNRWRYVQGTFWQLKLSQVVNIHEFTGRKK